VKQTVLKDTSTAILDAIGMTWSQVGIAFKELPEIRWRTNVFPRITAVLSIQAGSMADTRQLPKEWSLVKSVMITGITRLAQATAVNIVTI